MHLFLPLFKTEASSPVPSAFFIFVCRFDAFLLWLYQHSHNIIYTKNADEDTRNGKSKKIKSILPWRINVKQDAGILKFPLSKFSSPAAT